MSQELEELRRDVIKSLTQIEDSGYRAVLSLLLRMMDTHEAIVNEMFKNLNRKLDLVLEDEERIKKIVLNGHIETHVKHHKWVDDKINEETKSETTKNAIVGGIAEKVATAAVMFIIGVVASKLFPHLFS